MDIIIVSLTAIPCVNVLQITWQFILALLLIFLGFLVAKGLELLTSAVLKIVQLDALAKLVGLDNMLEKADIKKSLAELLGALVYWLIVFYVIVFVAAYFGLMVEPIIDGLLLSIGVVILVALVLALGLFLASLISNLAKVVMVNLGIVGAKTASRLLYYIVVIITFLVALAELGIKPDVFVPQIGVIIGAFGLAAAIAFGLGCKDMAADFLHNLFKGR